MRSGSGEFSLTADTRPSPASPPSDCQYRSPHSSHLTCVALCSTSGWHRLSSMLAKSSESLTRICMRLPVSQALLENRFTCPPACPALSCWFALHPSCLKELAPPPIHLLAPACLQPTRTGMSLTAFRCCRQPSAPRLSHTFVLTCSPLIEGSHLTTLPACLPAASPPELSREPACLPHPAPAGRPAGETSSRGASLQPVPVPAALGCAGHR